MISTIAGSVSQGLFGDGGQAVKAELNGPTGVAALADGSVLVADTGNDRMRRIAPNGVITTVAGITRGLSGDSGPAIAALLNSPHGITPLPADVSGRRLGQQPDPVGLGQGDHLDRGRHEAGRRRRRRPGQRGAAQRPGPAHAHR